MPKTFTPQHLKEIDRPLSSVSFGGRPLCSLRFADDIDLLGGSAEDLQQLYEILDKTAARYGTEISSDKKQNPGQ